MTRAGCDRATAPDLAISFEGRPIPARLGESVASALTAAGVRTFRTLRSGAKRGLFCGMGVCQECLVVIDGQPGQRACMTKIVAPIDVRIQTSKTPRPVPEPHVSSSDGARDTAIEEPEVLVIGGGAGGLTAAAAAAEAGATVTLIDERPALGGQYFKQPAALDRPLDSIADDAQFEGGRRAIDRAKRAGVNVFSATVVWGAFPTKEIGISGSNGARLLRPRRLIVATGAYERPWPVPGWTLPGVMTTGCAQTLVRSHRVLPGRTFLICGNGPLNMQVALELSRAGANVVAVVELAKRPGISDACKLWRMASRSPRLTINGIRMVLELGRQCIPTHFDSSLCEVKANGNRLVATIRTATTASEDRSVSFDVDTVCLGYGFLPQNEILRALDCRHEYEAHRSQLMTIRTSDCETTQSGVYAVGDCCGLGGAFGAISEGEIAGTAAARSLGYAIEKAQPDIVEHKRQRANQLEFQSALWSLFDAQAQLPPHATGDTIICRCEEVTLSEIKDAISRCGPLIGAVKRETRAGMGSCQGRYCTSIIASLLASHYQGPIDEGSFYAPRAPVKPISISDLVRTSPQ